MKGWQKGKGGAMMATLQWSPLKTRWAIFDTNLIKTYFGLHQWRGGFSRGMGGWGEKPLKNQILVAYLCLQNTDRLWPTI